MKILSMISVLCLVFTCAAADAADTMEGPPACNQCGMDRAFFARSRVLIIYSDGTTAGECSLHCAAVEMGKNRERKVKSLMVADYATTSLIAANTATWVVGGRKEGVMTTLPKWAFAKEDDAKKFIQENGGRVTSFDQVMVAASEEAASGTASGHGRHGHMGPGNLMLFNPAFGDDIYHTHPAGMWMVNYKFMHTGMSGLQAGTSSVSLDRVIPMVGTQYGFMMAPTSMAMDMHMVMAMYGVTDRLTVSGMANYQVNTMDMLMNMGMANVPQAPMRTSGFGDTEVRGIFRIAEGFAGSIGLSIPTGDSKQVIEMMGMTFRAPYDMQLGSGTFDLKPALTYNTLSGDALWNWGAQAMYTFRTGRSSGYSLGDSVKVTSWLQRTFGPAVSWFRLAFSDTGRLKGHDVEIDRILDPVMGAPMPDADPRNYGGERLDGLIGISLVKGPFSFGVEAGLPLYQYLNGLQLKTDWMLTAGMQTMF